jgi:hypothetical protein
MTHTVVTAPAFTVLDLPVGERILIGLARRRCPAGTPLERSPDGGQLDLVPGPGPAKTRPSLP